MEAGPAPKEFAARPAVGRVGPISSPLFAVVFKKCVRGAIQLFLKAIISFQRLIRAIARHPGVVLAAILRVPRSLAKLVRWILYSKPTRLLAAAAASIICITLQWHRPTVANIKLSSSISLLFGMIKLQGSLSLQLGPPDSRCSVTEQQAAPQQEELRINCPKDLKDHIVRFLESQAARNLAAAASATATVSAVQLSPQNEQHPEDEKSSLPLLPLEEPVTAATAVDAGAVRGVDHAASPLRASQEGEEEEAGVPGCADGGSSGTRPANFPEAAVPPALEELLPSTPPLACSPQGGKSANSAGAGGGMGSDEDGRLGEPPQLQYGAAFLAALGPAEAAPALHASDYLSLMSYAASYKPCVAALDSSWAGAVATPGRLAGAHDGLPQSATAETAVRFTEMWGTGGGGGGGCGGVAHTSPGSILGLRDVGLEGWAESRRRWESRYKLGE